MLFGLDILDLIGGYVEFVFVPPFIVEWQQMTAERTLTRERKSIVCKLATDIRVVENKIGHVRRQCEALLDDMHKQEETMRMIVVTNADAHRVKTAQALYAVTERTATKLRTLIFMLSRVKSQLQIRQAIITCTVESLNATSCHASSAHLEEFQHAAARLAESEIDVDAILAILQEDGDLDFVDGNALGAQTVEKLYSRLRDVDAKGDAAH